jgi:outer membrane protein TolC
MRVFASVLSLLLCAGFAPADPLVLDRTQAVQLALEQNESYQAALLEEDRVSGQYIEARSGALPRLSLDGSYLRNIDLQTSVFSMTDEEGNTETMQIRFGTPHNYSVGLNLYQPLYAAGQVGAAIKIAGYGRKYTDAGIIQARHDISTAADRTYLDAVAAREAEMIFREAERLADSNLAVVRKLYEQGQVSEYDFLRAQVRAANTRPDRIAAVNRTRLAYDRLRNILALEPETEIKLASSIGEANIPDLTLKQLTGEALQNRPELHQSEQMIKINDKLITIASSGYRPNLGISSRVQWDSFNDKFKNVSISGDSWHRSWYVALVLDWPLFSGFETKGKTRQARVDYSQSKLANSQLVRRVRLEVKDAYGKVDEAKQRVEALGETVSQAERGVEIAQIRFNNGIGIQLELLDAQVALTTARVNRIRALYDLAVAVSEMRRVVGREWAAQW